jgi:hypothetical protein
MYARGCWLFALLISAAVTAPPDFAHGMSHSDGEDIYLAGPRHGEWFVAYKQGSASPESQCVLLISRTPEFTQAQLLNRDAFA